MTGQEYLFTGCAVGVAGGNLFPSKAMISLPMIGGEACSEIRGFRKAWDTEARACQSVGLRNAVSKATGQETNLAFETNVSSEVRHLQFRQGRHKWLPFMNHLIIEAHNLRAELCSVRPKSGGEEAVIKPVIDAFHLTVLGKRFTVHLSEALTEITSKTLMDKMIREKSTGEILVDFQVSESQGYYIYSLVDHISWEGELPDGIAVVDNTISIRGIGVLHLAEMARGFNSARLALVRLELDDSITARNANMAVMGEPEDEPEDDKVLPPNQAVFCEVQSNGIRPDNT